MRLFHRPKPEPEQPRTSPALLDLQDRMERLERIVRDLKTDWAQEYDKFHRLNMRLAKRQKALDGEIEPNEPRSANRPGSSDGERVIQNPLAAQLLRKGRY